MKMDIKLEIDEEQNNFDVCSLELNQPQMHGENFADIALYPELKFQISECKMDAKVEFKQEPLNADIYSIELKPETKEEDFYDADNGAVLRDEEEQEFNKDVIKMEVEEFNLPGSDAGPNREQLSRCLENSTSTSFIKVIQKCKGKTNKPTFPYISTQTLSSSIKQHLSIHKHKRNKPMHEKYSSHKKPHKCEICVKSFSQACHLSRHLLIHEGKKPHKCEVCEKSFAQASDLRRHLMIHEGNKPHKCKVCEKSFAQACHLREHLLIHEGKKPHKCEICEKSFTRPSTLKGHILMHEGKKPHKCEVCGKSFTLKSNLRGHLLAHKGHKPHKCKVCERGFTQAFLLRRHFSIHK